MRPSTGSGDVFKFTRLNSQNYAIWAMHCAHGEHSLIQYLWIVVDGTEPHPESPVAMEGTPFAEAKCMQVQEVQDWITKDKAASGIIHNGCEISQWPHIQSCLTSKDIWDALQRFHHDNLMFTTTSGSCFLTDTSKVLSWQITSWPYRTCSTGSM